MASTKENKVSYITRKDVKVENVLGERIDLSFVNGNGREIFLKYNDSVLIVGNPGGLRKEMIEFYNLKSKKKMRGFFEFGKGDNRVASGIFNVKGDYLFILESNDEKIIVMDIPKLLHDSTYQPAVYSTKGNFYCDADFLSQDTFITTVSGYYYDFVSIAKKYNKGIPRFFIMDLKKDTIHNGKEVCDFTDFLFLSNYQSENVSVNRVANRIVTASSTLPEITLYDLNRNVIKVIIGPDVYDQPINIDENKNARSDGYYRSFREIFKTKNGFFVINSKVIGEKSYEKTLKPSELLEFNWDGELLNIYQLDRNLSSISVIEGYLYGMTYDYITQKVDFYKFKLKTNEKKN